METIICRWFPVYKNQLRIKAPSCTTPSDMKGRCQTLCQTELRQQEPRTQRRTNCSLEGGCLTQRRRTNSLLCATTVSTPPLLSIGLQNPRQLTNQPANCAQSRLTLAFFVFPLCACTHSLGQRSFSVLCRCTVCL